MATNIIQVNYEQLDQISQLFDAGGEQFSELERSLRQCAGQLESGWIGMGSDAFFAEFNDEVMPRLKRLIAAYQQSAHAIRQIAEVMYNAEQEAAGQFGGIGHAPGMPGSPGGGSSVPGFQNAPADSRWGDLMDWSFGFKTAGDAWGILTATPLFEATGLGLLLTPGGQGAGALAIFGPMFVTAGLKYGEKFDEEPNLFRGGTIALYDAAINELIGLHPAGAVIGVANSAHQLYADLEVIQSRIMAETYNLSPSMQNSLFESTNNYFETASKVDIGNVTYEFSRLLYDVQTYVPTQIIGGLSDLGVPYVGEVGEFFGLDREANNPMLSGQRTVSAIGDIFIGAVEYPERWLDLQLTQGGAELNNWVNNSSWIPQDLQRDITQTSDQVIEYVNQNSFVDMGRDVVDGVVGGFNSLFDRGD
ncbi:MAG: WXG100 family type VII secretion target [Anaerolineae bacterium]|jgi:WXG100 family type VII secretion target|nr:WXG100 family type VII secretion target [Anaerolineae bacterium]